MSCPNTHGCPLFPLFRLRASLRVWQIQFCESDSHASCARFRLAAAGSRVPPNLLPNGRTLAVAEAPPGPAR
jgi:hypothetical protein